MAFFSPPSMVHSRAVGTNRSSLVHVIIPGITVIHAYGEVLEIFQFNQRFHNVDDSLWFARMRWFVPWRGEREKVWDDLTEQKFGRQLISKSSTLIHDRLMVQVTSWHCDSSCTDQLTVLFKIIHWSLLSSSPSSPF
ncbi:hypothetical protein BDR07DRAFT_1419902, partial [Suillus spraguei]